MGGSVSTGSLLKVERRKGRGSTRSRHGMKRCVAAMCGRRCEHSSLLKLERREGRPARNRSTHYLQRGDRPIIMAAAASIASPTNRRANLRRAHQRKNNGFCVCCIRTEHSHKTCPAATQGVSANARRSGKRERETTMLGIWGVWGIYMIAMNAYRHISDRARVPLRDILVELLSISKRPLQQ